jgi:hypothetical protein
MRTVIIRISITIAALLSPRCILGRMVELYITLARRGLPMTVTWISSISISWGECRRCTMRAILIEVTALMYISWGGCR